MCSDIAIRVTDLGKCYEIYETPHDRLKQFVLPRLRHLFNRPSKPYFREFWALKSVSFTIRKGETVGIIGRNGSGKSTLLQIICGTLTPTHGNVEVNGRVAALLELGSGFNPEFTGRENIYMNAAVLGLSKEMTDARFADIVAFADIGDFIEQPTKTYSSGMLVRLAFAVIAHVDADILVIDEALAVGDAFFTQKCMRFLRNFMKNGTVLFVSHDTGAVRSLCSSAIWLANGKTLEQGKPKEVCEHYLEAIYASQQGKTALTPPKRNADRAAPVAQQDQRQKFLNASNLRNDIRVVNLSLEDNAFGMGGARITSVQLLDDNELPLAWIVGGEQVTLKIQAITLVALDSPIIGFFLKDKLGQCLFGDNTYLSYMDAPVYSEAEQTLEALFSFQMPRLSMGEYTLTVAIADGNQEGHVQHHLVHDAVCFKSEASSVVGGIIGIPMSNIKLSAQH